MEYLKWIIASVIVSVSCIIIERVVNKVGTKKSRASSQRDKYGNQYDDIVIGKTVPNANNIIKKSLEKGKNGDPMGMLNIGVSYKNGVNGYPKDTVKAKRILQTVIDIAPGTMASALAKEELSNI